jgi:hypothetical protein
MNNTSHHPSISSHEFYEHTTPCQVPDLEIHVIEEELLIYDADGELGASLNHSAKLIWELCTGEYTVVEVSQVLAKSFPEIEPKDIFPDVVATITRLQQIGLLELSTTR